MHTITSHTITDSRDTRYSRPLDDCIVRMDAGLVMELDADISQGSEMGHMAATIQARIGHIGPMPVIAVAAAAIAPAVFEDSVEAPVVAQADAVAIEVTQYLSLASHTATEFALHGDKDCMPDEPADSEVDDTLQAADDQPLFHNIALAWAVKERLSDVQLKSAGMKALVAIAVIMALLAAELARSRRFALVGAAEKQARNIAEEEELAKAHEIGERMVVVEQARNTPLGYKTTSEMTALDNHFRYLHLEMLHMCDHLSQGELVYSIRLGYPPAQVACRTLAVRRRQEMQQPLSECNHRLYYAQVVTSEAKRLVVVKLAEIVPSVHQETFCALQVMEHQKEQATLELASPASKLVLTHGPLASVTIFVKQGAAAV